MVSTTKRKTSLTLDAELLDGAKTLGINVSAVAESKRRGLCRPGGLARAQWPPVGRNHECARRGFVERLTWKFTVRRSSLRRAGNVADQGDRINRAVDVLMTGV